MNPVPIRPGSDLRYLQKQPPKHQLSSLSLPSSSLVSSPLPSVPSWFRFWWSTHLSRHLIGNLSCKDSSSYASFGLSVDEGEGREEGEEEEEGEVEEHGRWRGGWVGWWERKGVGKKGVGGCCVEPATMGKGGREREEEEGRIEGRKVMVWGLGGEGDGEGERKGSCVWRVGTFYYYLLSLLKARASIESSE